ncbi:MAG: hypothetical protein WCG03_02135 [Kiritimatiellales bacterium]
MNVEATKVPEVGKRLATEGDGHKKHKKAPVFAGSYGLARKKVPGVALSLPKGERDFATKERKGRKNISDE